MSGALSLVAPLVIAAAVVAATWLGLPALLAALGLHPGHDGPAWRLPGGRALIVTTSHATLDRPGRPGQGRATGVYASEMTAPYFVFLDAGMHVDVASIRGGAIPIEPVSLRWPLATEADRRYLRDGDFRAKVHASLAIGDVDFARYDIVFLAGGWGAAYDLGTSDALARGVSAAWAAGKVVGGVCHGPLGLLRATEPDGTPLVRGKRLTAVTDRQVAQLGIDLTPQHPERELRAAGAHFESATALRDIFANHVVVDGRLVTGQNQNAGASTAQRMLHAAGGCPDAAAAAHAVPARRIRTEILPMTLVLRIALALFAVVFLLVGVALGLMPLLAAPGFAVTASGIAGLGTLRADLGGCFVGLGVFTLAGLRPGHAGWLAVPLAFVGAFLGLRLLHLGFDGVSEAGVRSTVVEAVLVALLLAGRRVLARA
jgi:putative intracellular protease/amidase